jgi:hypothetical protein
MGTFSALQTTTVRDFSGGLNVVTDDLNMSTAYSTIETNVFNNINGTKSVRYGTKFFKDYSIKENESIMSSVTKVTHYGVNFNQNANRKVPVGVQVYIYSDQTKQNLFVSGIIYFSSETNFELFTDTQIIPSQATYYLDYYNGDVLNPTIEVTGSGSTNQQYIYFTEDTFPALTNLLIGDLFMWYDINGSRYFGNIKIVDIVEDSNGKKHYYCWWDSGQYSQITENEIQFTVTTNNISGTRFVNGTYFIDKLVLVTDLGEVCLVDGEGNLSVVFNDIIANNINREHPGGWHETDSVCFAVFNGILTIWNGKDKPLAVDLNNKKYVCNYLIDQGTMSNSFIPRAKYAIGFNHYLVAGNVYSEEEGRFFTDRLCISAKDAIGTFYSGLSSDVGNDAVNIDLGTIISSNGLAIKGLSRYRNQLVVGFDDASIFGTLGNYIETTSEVDGVEITEQIHKPEFSDVIDKHGCISNRTYTTISSSLICLDYSGVPNFSRRNISASVLPNRISNLIAPEIYKKYNNLTEKTIEDRIFAVNNPKENQYLLFIPNNDNYDLTTETVCYAYTLHSNSSNITDGAWSKFVGWNFDFGITTALNNVFFGKGLKLYTLGSIDNPYYRDYIDDPDYPATNDADVDGKAIDFIWEMPWTDFGDRAALKKSRYIALSTTGSANFVVDMFVDYLYINRETGQLIPSLSMDFVAGDSYGYGNGATDEENLGQQLYGGGRRTNTEFLFAWTTRYKIAKFRISGSTKFKLNINSLTFYYQRGNIRR